MFEGGLELEGCFCFNMAVRRSSSDLRQVNMHMTSPASLPLDRRLSAVSSIENDIIVSAERRSVI